MKPPSFFWEPNANLGAILPYIAAGLVLASALAALLRLWGKKRREAALPPLERPRVIRGIFEAAAERRSHMDIICALPNARLAPLQGRCLPPDNGNQLRIEIANPTLPDGWQGAPADVYFTFIDRGERTFHHFTGNILDSWRDGSSTIVALPFPAALTNNQRRNFVRVRPDVGMTEALTLWPCPEAPPALPSSIAALGRPAFVFRPPAMTHVSLTDISANGILVRLSAARLQETRQRWAPGDQCVMLLVLKALTHEESGVTLWLACMCRRVFTSQGSSDLSLGMQFTHWCAPTSLNNPIVWQDVERDGETPPLSRWTARANILLSRRVELGTA